MKDFAEIKNYISTSMDKSLDLLRDARMYLSNALSDAIVLFFKIKDNSDSVVENNLKMAKYHFGNNNMFDAKIRYKIALMFDKKNFDAAVGLAYIYYMQMNHEKTIKYFNLAKSFCSDSVKIEEIDSIIDSLMI